MTPMSKSKRKSAPQGAKLVHEGKPARLPARAAPLTRPKNGLDGFEFLTPCEAITWAAFGQAVKADELIRVLAPELARLWSGPKTWLPKLFFFHDPFEFLEFSPNLILKALEGHSYSEVPLTEEQIKQIGFYMGRRGELGLSDLPTTPDHIAFLRQYLSWASNTEMRLMESKREFQKLIGLGHIRVAGHAFDKRKLTDHFGVVSTLAVDAHSSRKQISKEVFLPGISIDFEGYVTDATGHILFEGLAADLDDVRRAYPFGPIGPLDPSFLKEAAISVAPVEQGLRKRHAGGRPQSKSAELVVEEMVRLLRLNQLPADKASAKEQMTHLLMDRGYGDPLPSEQSLENWIKPFYSKL